MTSYKNFSQKSRAIKEGAYDNFDNALSHDPKKQKKINYENWTKFLSYYRYYIDEFACDILGLKLYPFQRLMLRCRKRKRRLC